MRHRLVLVVLALATVAVAGCEVEDLLKRGEQAMQAGRYDEAVRCFEDALAKEPKLADQPEFMATLTRARAYAAYDAGRRLADAGQWAEAARRFADVLAIDPAFPNAREAHDRSLREAARVLHAQAVAAADAGDLAAARRHLEDAAAFDPQSADVRAAQASLDTPADARSAAAGPYQEGQAASGRRDWGPALAAFRRAVDADPNHLPARAQRARAQAEVARAQQHHAEAARLLGNRELDQAIAAARQALAVWPSYPEARQTLDAATTRRAQADAAHTRAVRAAEAGKHRDALREAEAARAIFPAHPGARQVVARSAYALGLVAQQSGRPGSALLWFLDAQAAGGDPAVQAARRAAEDAVRQRVTVRLAVADARSDAGAAAADQLRGNVLAILGQRGGDLVRLVDAGAAPPPAYLVDLRLRELGVRTQSVGAETRAHAYTVNRQGPNPEVIRIRRELDIEERRLDRMRREWQRRCTRCNGTGRLACPVCNGAGTVACGDCGGSGRVVCPQCNGTGQVGGAPCPQCNGAGQVNCATCNGTGRLKCPRCGNWPPKPGWIRCPRCEGSGRAADFDEDDLDRQVLRVRNLRAELLRTPPLLVVETPAQWPYTVQIHEKTARAAGTVAIRRADGASLRQEALEGAAAARDETIVNPNPQVGLAADPLQFPADRVLQDNALAQAAGQAADWVLAAVAADFEATVRAAADRFVAEGKTDDALEVHVDLAILTRAARPDEGNRMLETLRAEQRKR